MLIPIGFFSAGGATAAFEHISTSVLSSAVTSVNFDVSALGSYKHLQIRYVARTSRAVTEDGNVQMYFNNDTAANYRSHYLVGTGSSVVSYDNGANMGLGSHPAANAGANQFLGSVIDILDPFSTSKNKTVRILAGSAGSVQSVRLASGVWLNTAAVTNIQLSVPSSTWTVASRFSLYGLRG